MLKKHAVYAPFVPCNSFGCYFLICSMVIHFDYKKINSYQIHKIKPNKFTAVHCNNLKLKERKL